MNELTTIVHYKSGTGGPFCHQRGFNLNVTIHPWEVSCSFCKRKMRQEKEKEGQK